jgi:hypothetical protein
MKVCFVAVAAALTLGACQQTVSQMNYSELRTFVGEMGKRCDAQGVKRGTKEMEHCIAVEVRRENSARMVSNQRREAALDALQGALIASGNRPTQTRTECSRTLSGGFDCTTW